MRRLPLWLRIYGMCLGITMGMGIHTQAPLIALTCQQDNQPSQSQSAQDKCAAVDVLALRSWDDLAGWLGDTIHDRHEEIITVATAVLAWFTFTLWRATTGMLTVGQRQHREMQESTKAARAAASAAQASADALPALERAYVFLDIAGQNIKDNLAIPPIQMLRGEYRSSVWFNIVNHGKTPAVITEISRALKHLPIMDEPSYDEKLPLYEDMIVPGSVALGQNIKGKYDAGDPTRVNEDIRMSLATQKTFMWFYGRIVYKDVFGKEHVTSWWRRFNITTQAWDRHGDPKYNQRT